MPHEQQSHAGREETDFLWVKHSIRTLKISGLCTSLSYMDFWVLRAAVQGRILKDI